MKFFLILWLSMTMLASCSSPFSESNKRRPSGLEEDFVVDKNLNATTCSNQLDALLKSYEGMEENADLNVIKNQGQELLDQSFKERLAIHGSLSSLPDECKIKVKKLFLKMRMMEDYIGVHFYNDKQISADTIKYQSGPIPVYEKGKYHPYHLGNNLDPKTKFEFRNGDIMITKGVSFVSSTISELAAPKSLFSHIVFVHVDEKTKAVSTIESYVGQGVGIYPIEYALKNENARILVLRAKDGALAGKAADYMYERVMKLKAKKKVILYDYKLDFSENKKLSCEEVAFDAFKTMSEGQFIIPELPSEILLEDENFLNRLGLKKGAMMVPSDMEVDSRFEIVLDWSDYRVLRDSWRKDAVLGEMFRWVSDHNYRIHENMTSILAKVIWSTRYVPGLWGMMSKVSGIPKDFTKDVPNLTISTMASLKTIGKLMLSVVTKADNEYFEKSGQWMTSSMLRKALDDYRLTNPEDLRKVFREK